MTGTGPEKAHVYKLPNGHWAAHCRDCGTVAEYQTWEYAIDGANMTAGLHRGGDARMRVVLYIADLATRTRTRL